MHRPETSSYTFLGRDQGEKRKKKRLSETLDWFIWLPLCTPLFPLAFPSLAHPVGVVRYRGGIGGVASDVRLAGVYPRPSVGGTEGWQVGGVGGGGGGGR